MPLNGHDAPGDNGLHSSDVQEPEPGHAGLSLRSGEQRSKWRFLLVWPIVTAYRRNVRQSLSWRLAGSHHSTVLLTLFLIGMLLFGLTVGFTLHETPIVESPDREARVAAMSLQQLGLNTPGELESDLTGLLLQAMTTTAFNRGSGAVAGTGLGGDSVIFDELDDASSISVIDADGNVLASSNGAWVGTDAALSNPIAAQVAAAVTTMSPRGAETVLEDRNPSPALTYGSYPLRDDTGQIIGAVVVAKNSDLIPAGSNLLVETVVGVIAGGLFFIFLFSIPALPAAAFLGIRRARAISRPIRELARAAGLLAAGDMRVRVQVNGEDEIAHLGTSFNRMADRLEASLATEVAARARAEQLLAANRDLVANVSHELRTPVALIRSHLEALEDDPTSGEEYTRIALRETDRLERLVNDLFQLVRLENHIVQLEREPIDAASAVREAVESLVEPTRRTAGITMQAVIEPGDLTCLGDRARLVQVLQNLIRNAIRFTHEGGIILVGARPDGDRIALFVQDTGIGIGPDDLPFVFDRFYRSDRSRSRSGGGAGLGLAIARQLVEQMGGELSVASDVGEGSTFTICLQRVRDGSSVAATPANTSMADGLARTGATAMHDP